MAARLAPNVRVPATIGRRWMADMVLWCSGTERNTTKEENHTIKGVSGALQVYLMI